MEYLKRVYCEYQFLVDWLKSKPNVEVTRQETIQRAKNWLSVGQLLNECDLAFDFSAEEKEEKVQNKAVGFEYINFRLLRGRGLHFSNKIKFPNFEQDDPFSDDKERNAYYLTSMPNEKCIDLSSKHGTLILNVSLLLESNIFNDNGMPIPSDTFKSWDFFDEEIVLQDYMKYSCNSIIIVDNYLIPSLDRCLESNILPIVEKLLNKEKNHSQRIEISVFSFTKDRTGNNYSSNCNKLVTSLRGIDENRIKVKIYGVTGKDFHDRVIITNNLWFGCGKGFTEPLFSDVGVLKSTSISLLTPFIQTSTSWCNEAYYNLMKDIAKVLRRSYTLDVNMWGDEEEEKLLIRHFRNEIAKNNDRVYSFIKPEEKIIENENFKIKTHGFIDLSQFASRNNKRFRK